MRLEHPPDLPTKVTIGRAGIAALINVNGPQSPGVDDDDAPVADAIRDFLVEELSLGTAPQPQVWPASWGAPPAAAHDGAWPYDAWLRFSGLPRAAIQRPSRGCQCLSFATELPADGPAYSARFVLSMGIVALIILAVSVWAVSRLRQLRSRLSFRLVGFPAILGSPRGVCARVVAPTSPAPRPKSVSAALAASK